MWGHTRVLLSITMPKLPALSPHPRRAGRYAVLVDGVPLPSNSPPPRRAPSPRPPGRPGHPDLGPPPALLDAAAIHTLGLKLGADLSEPTLAAIARAAELVDATDRALALIALRSHSSREVARKLAQKGIAKPAIDAAVTRLVDTGLLDDRAFTESFVRSRLVGRGQSRRKVAAELAKRGIPRAEADHALSAVAESEEVSELDQARKAAGKKVRSLAKLEYDVARRRLAGYLMRQGFGGDVVRQVTAELVVRQRY